MQHLVVNRVGKPRRATLNGREHIIVPMTMIVPGVLDGSNGALYYSLEEISRNASDWNGMPILNGHSEGSGRDPEVINKYGLGQVFNSRIHKNCLRADAWFDIIKLQQLAPDALSQIETGKAFELSTGFRSDFDSTPGTYNGRPYKAAVKGIRPDHLAMFMDGQVGACSVRDGCGVNNEGGVWRTIRGSKVFIEDGKITKGPKGLIGKNPKEGELDYSYEHSPKSKTQQGDQGARAFGKTQQDGSFSEKEKVEGHSGRFSDSKKLVGGDEGLGYVAHGTIEGIREGKSAQQAFFDSAEDQNYYGDRADIKADRERVAKGLNDKYGLGIDPHWEPRKTKNSQGDKKMAKTNNAQQVSDARGGLIELLVTNCGCKQEELDKMDDSALQIIQRVANGEIPPKKDSPSKPATANSGDPTEEDEDEGVDEDEAGAKRATQNKGKQDKKAVANKATREMTIDEWLIASNAPEELKQLVRNASESAQSEKEELITNIEKSPANSLTKPQLAAMALDDQTVNGRFIVGLRSLSEMTVPQGPVEIRMPTYLGAATTNSRQRQADKPTPLGLPSWDDYQPAAAAS